MARISFSALVEEIVGKLAGSVFQDSYGGMQVRTRVSPRNPRSQYQQLRRGEFGYISALWRTLTSVQRQTFIYAASTPPAALNLFIQSNVNLSLIEIPIIDTYVPGSVPDSMAVEFVDATPTEMTIRATGAVTTVPAGQKLLVQVTFLKAPTKIFTNPSQYSPVLSFDEGTDLSIPTDILTEWQARYGVLLPDQRVCLKANLIDKTNGSRGADAVNCTITEAMANKYFPLQVFTGQVFNVGAGVTDLYSYAMPANTLNADDQRLELKFDCQLSAGIGAKTVNLNIDGTDLSIVSAGIVSNIEMRATLYRTSNTTARVSIAVIRDSTTVTTEVDDIGVAGFDTPLTIKWTGQASGSNLIEAKTAFIDKVDAP